jgi:hypothetical protein
MALLVISTAWPAILFATGGGRFRAMPKHTETVLIYDPAVRTSRVFTMEVTGPQLVIDAYGSSRLCAQSQHQENPDIPRLTIV